MYMVVCCVFARHEIHVVQPKDEEANEWRAKRETSRGCMSRIIESECHGDEEACSFVAARARLRTCF